MSRKLCPLVADVTWAVNTETAPPLYPLPGGFAVMFATFEACLCRLIDFVHVLTMDPSQPR
jgi:hypothetical protein